MLVAMRACVVPPTTVILTGEDATCAEWARGLERAYRPDVRVLDLSAQQSLPTALSRPHDDASGAPASAWVCRGVACLPPIHSLKTLEEALASDE